VSSGVMPKEEPRKKRLKAQGRRSRSVSERGEDRSNLRCGNEGKVLSHCLKEEFESYAEGGISFKKEKEEKVRRRCNRVCLQVRNE